MAEEKESKENFIESLFKMMALMGGGWLAIEIIKIFAKKVYRCPHCNKIVQEDIPECPYCKVGLRWIP